MNEADVELRLDEDFLFILNFGKEHMNVFVNQPNENSRLQAWLSKLCCEVVEGVAAKRLRNTYLVRLISCMQSGRLTEPFDLPPQQGALPSLPLLDMSDPEPPWLHQLIQEAKEEQMAQAQAKDGKTYLATKVFEENRGACAYLAVSVEDEGEVPAWINMGTEKDFDDHLEKVFSKMTTVVEKPEEQQEETAYDRELHDHLMEAIALESVGLTDPHTNPKLEKMIEKFMKVIAGTGLASEAEKLSGEALRNFILLHLQSYLINLHHGFIP